MENSSPAPQGCVTVPDAQLRIPQAEPGMRFFYYYYFLGIPLLDCSQGLKKGLGPYTQRDSGSAGLHPEALRQLVGSGSGQQLWRKPRVLSKKAEVWPHQDRDWNPSPGRQLTLC